MLEEFTVGKEDQDVRTYYTSHFMLPLHEVYLWGRWAISIEKLVNKNACVKAFLCACMYNAVAQSF